MSRTFVEKIMWNGAVPLPRETEEIILRDMCVAYIGIINPQRPALEANHITRRCTHCGQIFQTPAGSLRLERYCKVCR